MKRQPAIDLDEFFTDLRASVRREFEDHLTLKAPRAYVLLSRDPKLGFSYPKPMLAIVMPSDFQNTSHKNGFASYIASLAKDGAALAMAFVAETWTASPRDESEEAARELEEFRRSGRSLEDWPSRTESIVFTFQKLGTSRTEVWLAPIRRDGDAVTLEEFRKASDAEGRFVGLMPNVN